MTRRLIVMRHAKSSWTSDAATDHARPLNERGRRDAPRVAQRLLQLGWRPQLVLSSDSQRTRETFDLMQDEWEDEIPIRFLPSLYAAGLDELTNALRDVPQETTCVMALGHNPGWEEMVQWLSGEQVRLTTANAALLEKNGKTWNRAIQRQASWKLHGVIRPKEIE